MPWRIPAFDEVGRPVELVMSTEDTTALLYMPVSGQLRLPLINLGRLHDASRNAIAEIQTHIGERANRFRPGLDPESPQE